MKEDYLSKQQSNLQELESYQRPSALVSIDSCSDTYAENCHVTMLLDAGDESLLRLQLYQAAEAPAPDVLKVFVAEDRSTWTLSNLQRLSISELARLQRYAGPTYSSALRLPINLLKLGGCTNNMAPFSAYLFPTDKFDLTHSNHGRVQFKLDAKVFESGTAKNSRAALQALKAELFGDEELEAYDLYSSPVHPVTLPDAARMKAGIPLDARFYAFCYPVDTTEAPPHSSSGRRGSNCMERGGGGSGATATAAATPAPSSIFGRVQFTLKGDTGEDSPARQMRLDATSGSEMIDRNDPFVCFLSVGAFLYFSFSYDIVAVNAISYDEIDSQTNGTLFLGQQSTLPAMAVQPLWEKNRWWPLKLQQVAERGFTHFAFITPSEFIGDHIFTQSGGFAYLHREHFTKSLYFPVSPKLTEAVIQGRGPSGTDLKMQISQLETEGVSLSLALYAVNALSKLPKMVPLKYDAPLHIEGLAKRTQNLNISMQKYFDGEIGSADFAAGRGSALGIAKVLGYKDDNTLLSCHGAYDDSIEAIRKEVEKVVASQEYGATESDLANMRYVLYSAAEASHVQGNDGTGLSVLRDEGHTGMKLADFASLKQARKAELSMAEVGSLRLYTTSTFHLVNNPLRTRAAVHPLAVTVLHISRGLKKLRALHMSTDEDGDGFVDVFNTHNLWRGMKDVTVSDSFMHHGGCELACLSTSENLKIIAGYARSASPLLFRLRVESPMERGASISWLSCFPQEEEVLYPPLTFIKPMFKQRIKDLDGGMVITVKPSFPS